MWSTAQLLSSGNADPHGERPRSGSRNSPPERAAAGRLIGRETELATLTGLLFDPTVRILTLTGPAGVGKSRLAHAVAHPALFGGDIVTVRLAAVREAPVAWAAIAAAAGLPGPYGPTQDLPGLLAARFGGSEVLLVLDDCDLVAAGVSLDIARLSAACRGLRILLTSRVSLDIYDERLFPVPPFPVSAPAPFAAVHHESPAVRLFVDRARAQRPDYTLLEEDTGVVKEICARLDGLPLAIELSAAAVGMLGPRALLGRLEHGEWPASSRLLDLPPRHRTVAASLSWGDPLLTPELRRFLQQLTVLEGQFDLATAQHLTDLSQHRLLGQVETLVHMSLLQRVERPRGDIWFRMLNMVRAYYRDHEPAHGGGVARARDRHAAYFAALAATAETRLRGSEQAAVLPAVRRRLKDYRAAVLHFQDHDRHPDAVRTLLALDTALDDLRCLPEALERLSRSLGHLEDDPEAAGAPGSAADDRTAERATAADGRPAGHRPLIARALETTAAWTLATGLPGADDMLRHAGDVHRDLGDETGAARVLGQLAEVERRSGESGAAATHAGLALAALDRLGDRRSAGTVRRTLGLLTDARDGDAAEQLLTRALEDLRAAGTPRDLVITLTDLARVRAAHDRPVPAWTAVREAMDLLRDTGGPRHVVRALETATRVLPHISEGQLHRAARLLLASQVIRERHELPESEDADVLGRVLERLRVALGESTLAVLRRQARATTPLAALNDALSAPPAAPGTSALESGGVLKALTPRQTEIAEMVASGLTNRQIARSLGLSEWTVINHLRQVMQKLKCPSRVHVARLVQQAAASPR